MNGELRRDRMNDMEIRNIRKAQNFSAPEVDSKDEDLLYDSSKCSGFTMMAVGASVLSFIGIMVYAIFA